MSATIFSIPSDEQFSNPCLCLIPSSDAYTCATNLLTGEPPAMETNTNTSRARCFATLLLVVFLSPFTVLQSYAVPHEYAATLIHQFEPGQVPYGPLVGKADDDLFGIAD